MIDVTFVGPSEVAIAGLIFAPGETKAFGDGSSDLTDDDAAYVLLNPNFIDAELGRNPNYTCACGKPLAAYVESEGGLDRSGATACGSCDAPSDDHPGEMPADLAAALASDGPIDGGNPSDASGHHDDLASDDAEPHLHDDN